MIFYCNIEINKSRMILNIIDSRTEKVLNEKRKRLFTIEITGDRSVADVIDSLTEGLNDCSLLSNGREISDFSQIKDKDNLYLVKKIDSVSSFSRIGAELGVFAVVGKNKGLRKIRILLNSVTLGSHVEYYILNMNKNPKAYFTGHRLLDNDTCVRHKKCFFVDKQELVNILSYLKISSLIKFNIYKRIYPSHALKVFPEMNYFNFNKSVKKEVYWKDKDIQNQQIRGQTPRSEFRRSLRGSSRRFRRQVSEIPRESISEGTIDIIEIAIGLLQQTGALLVGSYPLQKLLDLKYKSGDIDIFSHSLSFLRLFLKEILSSESKYSIFSSYVKPFHRLDSYKFRVEDKRIKKCIEINFVHVGRETVPQDIELDPEENRKLTMDFFTEKFDISACITCYDGESFHYNDSIERGAIECRYSTKSRVQKYISRGFTVDEEVFRNTCEFYKEKNHS